jgi:hypothetical protein
MAKKEATTESIPKIYVKIKDPNGSHFIKDQQISVFAAKPAEVDKTEMVEQAIKNGVLVEIEEKEFNSITGKVKSTDDENNKQKDAEKNNRIEACTNMVNEAIDLNIITQEGDTYKFGNTKLGKNLEAVVEKILANNNLFGSIQSALIKAKTSQD